MLLKYIEETVRESLVRCRRRAFGRKYGQNDGICNWLSVSVLRNIDISRLCDQAFIARRLLSFRVAIAISWCGRNRGGTPETCQNGHANRSKPLHDAVAEASWRRRWCRATAILSLVGWVGKVPIMMNNVNTKAVDGRAEAAFRVWCGPPVARAGGPVSHRLSTAKKIRLIICACRNNDLSLPCYPPLAPRPCLTAGTMRAKPFNPKQSLSRR